MAVESPMNRLFQQAGTNKAPTGTGYTNLNRFLGANAGNQLGAKVSGNLQNQIGGVQNQLQEEKTSFEKEAEKNRLDSAENTAARDSIIGRFASPSTAGGELGEEDVSKVTQFRTGQYAGPTGLKDTTALSQQAQDLAAQTGNLSSSGTQELLRRSIGGGRYTQGQQRLDSILMDRSGLRQVGREAQALGSDVNRANLAAQGQAQALAGQAAQFGQQTQQQLQGALSGLDAEAMKQLENAQGIESARQAQLEQLQRTLQGNQIAKLDANGNPVLDDNGKPVYETKLTGTTDPYARIDEISALLKGQGLINQNQYEALFGQGTFGQNKSTYDQQLADIRKNELNKALESGTGANLYNLMQATKGNFTNNNYIQGVGTGRADTAAKDLYTKAQNYIAANKLDANDPNSYNVALSNLFKSGDVTEENLTQLAPSYNANYGNTASWSSRWTPYSLGNFGNTTEGNANRASSLESFKNATGIAGRSTLDSRQDQFYNTLAQSLGANSTAAQNLTKEAVAAAPIRNNYAALSQLLGTPDLNTYTGDPTYQAGTVGLDAAQIRRALGY